MVNLIEQRFSRLSEMLNLSLYKMCSEAGVSYKTLSGQLKNNRAVPVDTLDSICGHFDIPLGFFSKHNPTMGFVQKTPDEDQSSLQVASKLLQAAQMEAMRSLDRISTTDVLNWLSRTGGRLEEFDALQESVDLFHKMGSDDNIPNPFRIGRKSLATMQFKIQDEAHYIREIGSFHPAILESIKRGRIEASYHPYMVADVEIRGNAGGAWISKTYRRLTAKVYAPDGSELTLVHAELVPNTHQPDRATTGLDLIQPQASHADALQE